MIRVHLKQINDIFKMGTLQLCAYANNVIDIATSLLRACTHTLSLSLSST